VRERFGREKQVARTAELYLDAWRLALGAPAPLREPAPRVARVPEPEAGGR
jgi:hypothetical protein